MAICELSKNAFPRILRLKFFEYVDVQTPTIIELISFYKEVDI